jgi:hypothetical protein
MSYVTNTDVDDLMAHEVRDGIVSHTIREALNREFARWFTDPELSHILDVVDEVAPEVSRALAAERLLRSADSFRPEPEDR